MKKKKHYKSWEETKCDIEETLANGIYCANDSELCLESGLQLKHTISQYPSPLFSVTYHADQKDSVEYYVMNYMSANTGESKLVEWKYSPKQGSSRILKKVTIRQCLKHLIWIQPQHAFLGYCDDLTIRGYSGTTLEEKTRLTIHNTVLCMLYIDELDELITGGQAYVMSWKVKMIEFGVPVEPKEPPLRCDVFETGEWVKRLSYDKSTNALLVLTDLTVYILSMRTQWQIGLIHNSHDASLTYCTFYQPYSYFITAARDGTVHVYHTAAEALIHTFSAHRDGITGVMSLPQQPILISWSQTSGCLRMWRLDTFELANENMLAEKIALFQIGGAHRAFYHSESVVRIFDINILYNVFATVSSPVESFKLCSIRRTVPPLFEPGSIAIHVPEKVKFSGVSESIQHVPQVLDHAPAIETAQELSKRNSIHMIQTDNTIIDFRLVCVLDDHSILGVSPISGSVLNIIYPMPEMNKPSVDIELEMSGRGYYVVLSNGTLIDFDCSVNPGQIGNVAKPERRHQVLCVAAMELYIQDGNLDKRQQGIFVGLESGYIKLYDGGQAAESKKRESGAGGRRRSTRRRKSTVNELGPFLKMENMKAHGGSVNLLHVPFESSFLIENSKQKESVKNVLLSGGTDCRVIIWKATAAETGTGLIYDVILHKLRFVKWPEEPSCLALTNNVVTFGFTTGNVEMLKLNWKSFHSSQAQIKVEHNAFILSSINKLTIDSELHHKMCVLCANESHLLKLFVTSSKDGIIKIWDCEGQLVRELMLGDTVPSVCFASGRDLLVALRNHIVRIESFRYLPTDYLEILLTAVKTHSMPELEPEVPMPLDGNADGTVCVLTLSDDVVDEEPFQVAKSQKKQATERTSPVQTKRKKIRQLKRIHEDDNLEQIDEEEVPVDKDRLMPKGAPVIRTVDNAKEFIATLDPDKMARYPVAPDGYIPNSVIRDRVQPLNPSLWTLPPTRFNTLQRIQQQLSMAFTAEMTSSFLTYVESTTDEEELAELEDVMLYEGGKIGGGSRYHRQLELKKYLRGRREEGKLNIVIQDKSPSSRSRSVTPVKNLTDAESQPQQRLGRERMPSPRTVKKQAAATDHLSRLLAQLSRERWCPTILNVPNLEKGLLLVADVMKRTSVKICCEICSYVAKILQACKEYKEVHGTSPFTDTLEAEFSHQAALLLVQNSPDLQTAAAKCLVEFDDTYLKNCLLKHIMPKFIQTDEKGVISITTDDQASISAARGLLSLSLLIDVDRILVLLRMCEIKRLRGTRANEQQIMDGLTDVLKQQHFDLTEVGAWASFVLPLLPVSLEKKAALVRKTSSKIRRPSLQNLLPAVESLTRQPSVVIVNEKDERKFCMESFSGSDTNASAHMYYYQSDVPPMLGKTEGDRSRRTPNTRFRSDNDSEVDLLNTSMFRPISVYESVRKSAGLSQIDVRSKESNLRKESVQVLRVMKRSSGVRSQQDLTQVPSFANDRRLSARQLSTDDMEKSRSNLIRFSNMLSPSSRRISPKPSITCTATSLHAPANRCKVEGKLPFVGGGRVKTKKLVVIPHTEGDNTETTSASMKQESNFGDVHVPIDVMSMSSGYPDQTSLESFDGLSTTVISSTLSIQDGEDWRKILGHLRDLRLRKDQDDNSSGDFKPSRRKENALHKEPTVCFGRHVQPLRRSIVSQKKRHKVVEWKPPIRLYLDAV